MSPSFLLRCDRQEADVKRPIGHLTPTKATGNLGSSRDLSPVAFPSVAQLKATLLVSRRITRVLCKSSLQQNLFRHTPFRGCNFMKRCTCFLYLYPFSP
ncbi:unnamed protein product [Protopolystoma xenopodis]|uniref:Uncharacterized protein n=1 Tax=Protopolystoma xenopodis TaxID=117903 RepID=A0A3S4ZTT6_9PLAT|nr:unnamed protein product [Protopolystoma xenopodis]